MRGVDSSLQNLILEALAGDPFAAGFEVHYQPIVRMDDKTTVAVEALARWHHPTAGRIEPDAFVASAEHFGLIGVLDDFVLNSACADANALTDVYGDEVGLHVKVSASRLGRADLEAAIDWALERHRVIPGRLTIEITEASRIDDLEAAGACVQRLRERGVRAALDDFGSGFNALKQLHALPVDMIKLDAALTAGNVRPWRMETLCQSVLTICDQMGLSVIAEGIETDAQAQALQRMGCRLGQGYLYAMPLRLPRSRTTSRRAR